MFRRPIIEKLEDKDYVDSLNEKSKKKLLFCKEYLSNEELKTNNSINVAYNIARERYIEEVLKVLNPDMYKRIKNGDTIPIFSIFSELE